MNIEFSVRYRFSAVSSLHCGPNGKWSVVKLASRSLQLAAFIFLTSCIAKKESPLPIFGEQEVVGTDTVYHTIADFKFVDQDSIEVTNETFSGRIYVADFFFTSCRTICPIMKTQMLRVYDSIQNDPSVLLLSHTIDPEYDTVGLLHDFAERLGVKSDKWHFVTGNKEDIYKIAQTSYFSTALEDKTEPDGFIHSGAFLLIDKQRRIRGKYDGTKEEDVNRLLGDIQRLEKENVSN
ncbi:MAG: SCO family protein [Cyclobacteriaceae bacterium]|nr:SCO family protein [Cyclobacteriaceae bacterium]MDH4295807.1 SCO family protein [Cyclobacteriaceae bacterium]MDH5250747.1 SCO family protein [Cyclobacteriaceae bacterium]